MSIKGYNFLKIVSRGALMVLIAGICLVSRGWAEPCNGGSTPTSTTPTSPGHKVPTRRPEDTSKPGTTPTFDGIPRSQTGTNDKEKEPAPKKTYKKTERRKGGGTATTTYNEKDDKAVKQEYTYPDGTPQQTNHYADNGNQINAIFFLPDGTLDYINVFTYTKDGVSVRKITFTKLEKGLIKTGVIKTDAHGMPLSAK